MKTNPYHQKECNKLSKSHRKVSSNLQVRNTSLTFSRPKKDGGSGVTDEESRQKSGRFFLKMYRMYSMCAGLLLLLVTLSAVSAAELVQYGQCSLNFTDDKIINLRKSKELGGAVFLSSFSSDSLEDCSHSCCEDTAGQCSVAVYHDDTNMDNCYHINCPDPQTCVYQELAGYTLAVISRTIPQVEALGGTTTEKPATVTTKTTSTKAPEVIPQERMFKEKQQETTTVTTKAQVKLTTEQPSTAAKQQTTAAKQETKPATEEQQHTTAQPKPTGSQQQQTSTKPSTQLTTITRTTTTPKSLTTQTFTQKQTTKTATTTTTTVVSKATTKVDESVQTTQASKTPDVAVEEVKKTTQPMVAPTQAPTSKVQTVPPTNPPETEKPSPSPVPSAEPTTTSKKTQAVTVKTNPVPEATVALTKASSTGKSPDVTAVDTQPPTTQPAEVTTKKLMPGSTAKQEEALTQASLVQGSLGPQVANRNESVSTADKMGKSSYGSLIVAMCFGLLFLFAVVVVVGKRWYESWQRRHYSKIDYLINGMYN
ncbi:uncharacterized protein LOC144906768 [Branchiostoma floridae x Branchiostoma belcheri]